MGVVEMFGFTSKKKQKQLDMVNRGLLATRKPLNNQQRLAYWYYKQGAVKHTQQQELGVCWL